ncbi:hypothetical protein BpHYR1_054233 [Brachionus plicatilis]|uniref:Uncharacterized protein n=1 Tax=Brachionus plicatilis TaxID=10195 RepID=A0A3M7SRS7_BRAPC|nr:hypothetical protein BpHYR1_054233 [Brachionus plicatilis]
MIIASVKIIELIIEMIIPSVNFIQKITFRKIAFLAINNNNLFSKFLDFGGLPLFLNITYKVRFDLCIKV